MNNQFNVELTGAVVAVTGGSGILGGAMVDALVECGAAVAILDRYQDKAEEVVKRIVGSGGCAAGIVCDVLDKASLEAANEKIEKELGSIDILINAAGGNHPMGTTSAEFLDPDAVNNDPDFKTFYDLEAEGVRFVFDLNFLGTFLATQVFTKGMVKKKHGVVINISSMNAFTPLTKIPAYSAAKAAVSNFTQWLAVHFAKAGIRVNAIAPGFFLTEQNRRLLTNEDGSMTERGAKIIANTPMGRYGNPDELLGTLLWLASDQASGFVTGTVIPVDGGFNAYSGV